VAADFWGRGALALPSGARLNCPVAWPLSSTDFLGVRLATALDGVVHIWDWQSGSELMQIGDRTNAASR
jgi:hypothetical protein